MSIPTHNLYDYIHQVLEKEYCILFFYPWGSKKLTDVIDIWYCNDQLYDSEFKYTTFPKKKLHIDIPKTFLKTYQPVLFCHDQEPLNFELYKKDNIDPEIIKHSSRPYFVPVDFRKDLNLRYSFPNSNQKYWILLHSELNSHEVEKYEKCNLFIGAYWWSHAIIARDWYRFAQHDKNLSKSKKQKYLFLTYCRSVTGTRKYRQDFLDLCKIENLSRHCFCGKGGTSDSSSVYDAQDITSTVFHVVLETIFDQRIHLTEKTLRPIACGQPFIIANGPGSLEYLHRYGFKTFSPWINEAYNKIQDATLRLEAIVKEMSRLSKLSKEELEIVKKECYKIARHNKNVFFQQKFIKNITQELTENVQSATNKTNGELDWEIMWAYYKRNKKLKLETWKTNRKYLLNLIRYLKKGGTVENYVPPDLD